MGLQPGKDSGPWMGRPASPSVRRKGAEFPSTARLVSPRLYAGVATGMLTADNEQSRKSRQLGGNINSAVFHDRLNDEQVSKPSTVCKRSAFIQLKELSRLVNAVTMCHTGTIHYRGCGCDHPITVPLTAALVIALAIISSITKRWIEPRTTSAMTTSPRARHHRRAVTPATPPTTVWMIRTRTAGKRVRRKARAR